MMHLRASLQRVMRFAILPATLLANCGSQSVIEPPFVGTEVLFIGNSLTYFNDLPGMVAAMVDSVGAEPILVGALAFPNFGLEDHWNGGARDVIAQRAWDIVVLSIV